MSITTFEREIVAEARTVLCNPKVRLKDLMEWATAEIKPHESEIVVHLRLNDVWVAFPATCDKRAALIGGGVQWLTWR